MMTNLLPRTKRTSHLKKASSVRVVTALILREMSSTHGRSVGGYAWLVLEPILGIALLSFVFSYGFRTPALGINYPIFFATGILPFAYYNDMAAKVAQAINYSKALLAYPRVTFVDAMLARIILSFLTQMLATCLVLTGILLIFDTRTALAINSAMLSYAMATVLAIGVGLMNCFLFTSYPVWQRAWSIIMRPLLLLSGVLLLYDSMPRKAQDILWYNPLMHVTGEMRAAFYPQYEAKYVSPLYVFGVSFLIGLVGLLFLRRYHRDMLER